MRGWSFLAWLLFWLAAVSSEPALADKRVALVVGNSAYRSVAILDNPANDARLLADTLTSLGFSLVGGGAQLDLDKPSLDRAVQAFGAQLAGADVGLFYYAGHGVQVRGENYLIPVDANPTKEADVDFQMLDTNLVLRQMEGAGTRLNIVILDACRNNPFGGRSLAVGRARDAENDRTRAASGGLAQMQAPEGTLISFATQPGSVAQDGTGGNSPYARALALAMRRPALDIFQTFNQVGLAVKRATGGAQQPWVSSSPIDGSFYFVPPSSNPESPARPDTPALASISASSAPSAETRQFDGMWKGSLVCESPAPGGPGWRYELLAVVKNGAFRSQRGTGTRGSETFEGMIEPDGTAQIVQNGTSGETRNDPLHRPPGTPYRNTYIGTFDGSRATLARGGRVSCTVDLAKQDQTLVGSLAQPAASSDAGPQSAAAPGRQQPHAVPSADQPGKGQRSAVLESEPPGASGAPQAEGLFTEQDMRRVSSIAARDELVAMPKFRIERPDGKLPAALRKFVGIWASDIGFARGNGRHAMLIVTEVAAQGRASGYYVLGSPTARSLYKTTATAQPFKGNIAGDQLSFQEDNFDIAATIANGGSLAVVQKQKDGMTLNVTLNPVWRLLDAERSAKR
jgi:hypothetical protein